MSSTEPASHCEQCGGAQACSARCSLPAPSWCGDSDFPNRPREHSYPAPALLWLRWLVSKTVVLLFQRRWRVHGSVRCQVLTPSASPAVAGPLSSQRRWPRQAGPIGSSCRPRTARQRQISPSPLRQAKYSILPWPGAGSWGGSEAVTVCADPLWDREAGGSMPMWQSKGLSRSPGLCCQNYEQGPACCNLGTAGLWLPPALTSCLTPSLHPEAPSAARWVMPSSTGCVTHL